MGYSDFCYHFTDVFICSSRYPYEGLDKTDRRYVRNVWYVRNAKYVRILWYAWNLWYVRNVVVCMECMVCLESMVCKECGVYEMYVWLKYIVCEECFGMYEMWVFWYV